MPVNWPQSKQLPEVLIKSYSNYYFNKTWGLFLVNGPFSMAVDATDCLTRCLLRASI